MMSDYRRFDLGPEAIEYVREHLTYGSTLGKYLLSEKNLDKSTVITFLPQDVDVDQVSQFKAGGKVNPLHPEVHYFVTEDGSRFRMELKGNSFSHLAAVLAQFLRGNANRLCVIEEPLMRPGDPGFPDGGRSIVKTLNDEIYYLLSGFGNIDKRAIQDVVGKADRGFHFVCAMTSVPDGDMDLWRGRQITPKTLQKLARGTESIVVGAYDGEGYLIWSEIQSPET